jgi:hypothetical protein
MENCINAHGGWCCWESHNAVTLTIETLAGPLITWKGVHRWLARAQAVVVEAKAQRAHFLAEEGQPHAATYQRGAVTIDEQAYHAHRIHLCNKPMWSRWSHADTVYFFGYALVTYLSVPFILPELELLQFESSRRAFTVRFPETMDTHCPVQTFHFDETGLLYRHDYTAEVVGGWAKGSHFTENYTGVQGLQVAQQRRVGWRIAGRPTRMPVLRARLMPASA